MSRSTRSQVASESAASAADVSNAGEAIDAVRAASAADDENDAGTSGVHQELEDEIPSDLLANLIQVNAHDIKPAVRQDYARRMSKYYQFLVARLDSHGCHALDCRPTALPDKCLPNPRCKWTPHDFHTATPCRRAPFGAPGSR